MSTEKDCSPKQTEKPITCQQRDGLLARVGFDAARVSSSITNYVGDEVLDHRLPPHTATTWCDADGRDFLREVLDENGCRHWAVSS